MEIQLSEDSEAALTDYARIPIAYQVHSVLIVPEEESDLRGVVLPERAVETPYVKDYDATETARPTQWHVQFDLSNWGLIGARQGHRLVGAAAVAFNTPEVIMLEGRTDLAALWDIRVAPDVRGQGIGSALFTAVEDWATARGCLELKIETQNINVPACRFYQGRGCVLGQIKRSAYPKHPEEIQLLWFKALRNATTA